MLRLTSESKQLLRSALLKPGPSDIILTFKKVPHVSTYLTFFPQEIESMILDYSVITYLCESHIYRSDNNCTFKIIDLNIYFELYDYRGLPNDCLPKNSKCVYDIHCFGPGGKMSSIVEFDHTNGIYAFETLTNYMKQYYGVDNYFRGVNCPTRIHYVAKSNITKVLNHKRLKLAITMMKILLRVFKKLKSN